jgi:hypothetical protein
MARPDGPVNTPSATRSPVISAKHHFSPTLSLAGALGEGGNQEIFNGSKDLQAIAKVSFQAKNQ